MWGNAGRGFPKPFRASKKYMKFSLPLAMEGTSPPLGLLGDAELVHYEPGRQPTLNVKFACQPPMM